MPTIILGITVGSAIFASLDHAPSKPLQIGVGLLSLAATVLAALQTFLKYEDRTGEYEAASRAFGAIRRELGEIGALTGRPRNDVISGLQRLRERYDQISAASRNPPDRIWNAVTTAAKDYWPPEFAAWPERASPRK